MLKNKLKLFSIINLIIFALAVIMPLSARAQSICEAGKRRCNTRVAGYLQECKNCDKDEDLEWCNIEDCSLNGQVCIDSACQADIVCGLGQRIGDLNSDGRINDLDQALIASVISGRMNKPEDLCCVDMNSDGVIDQADSDVLDNVAAGREAGPGSCQAMEKPETGETAPGGIILSKKLIYAAAFIIIILAVIIFLALKFKKLKESKDN